MDPNPDSNTDPILILTLTLVQHMLLDRNVYVITAPFAPVARG